MIIVLFIYLFMFLFILLLLFVNDRNVFYIFNQNTIFYRLEDYFCFFF